MTATFRLQHLTGDKSAEALIQLNNRLLANSLPFGGQSFGG